MARRFLILHGLGNRRPAEHWQHRLADRLREDGEQVQYPQLPRPDAPLFDEWEELLRAELAQMSGERVVVCHSLGCTLWLGAAAAGAVRAERVLLVAPPSRRTTLVVAPSFAGRDRSASDGPVRAAEAHTLVCSDADPYNPEGEAPAVAERLGARLHVIPGAGHLAVDDGYGHWPAAEQWCLDPSGARF